MDRGGRRLDVGAARRLHAARAALRGVHHADPRRLAGARRGPRRPSPQRPFGAGALRHGGRPAARAAYRRTGLRGAAPGRCPLRLRPHRAGRRRRGTGSWPIRVRPAPTRDEPMDAGRPLRATDRVMDVRHPLRRVRGRTTPARATDRSVAVRHRYLLRVHRPGRTPPTEGPPSRCGRPGHQPGGTAGQSERAGCGRSGGRGPRVVPPSGDRSHPGRPGAALPLPGDAEGRFVR
ncbi:hypothetical protein SGPA1_11196 [Streptomyces misionensis JCM 4497]